MVQIIPNPATQNVNISYDYGSWNYSERSISIYDQMGRKIEHDAILDAHGYWNVNTSNWVPGFYIIRMEGDGKVLQMQKLVVSN